ncbi:MAG TPA: hypothetical protein EYG85_09350 [Crocinitomix sp.]|nr:hypothetical protein [Crocinitomix sp.]
MFDDLENYYPSKPKLPQVGFKEMLQKNLMFIVIFFFLLAFYFSENIMLIMSMVAAIIFHEFGHFVGMKVFKFNDKKIMYLPFLTFLLKQKTETVSQKQYLITILLGVIPGLLIGTILFYTYLQTQNQLLLTMSTLFIVINIFSVLPLDPLDGGKLVETVFFPNNNTFKLYYVLISSVVFIVIGFYFELYVLMIFGFLMAFKVKSIQRNDTIQKTLDNQEVDYKKPYSLLSDREYWKIRNVFLDNNPRIKELIPSTDIVWENENLLIAQISQILKIEIKTDASLAFKVLVFAILFVSVYFPIHLILKHWETVFQPIIESVNV